jgi:AcrR family transcriptional regulator
MPSKTPRKRQDHEAAIVDAALSLAAEGGFDNVRQRDVAARAGVTLRTLYRKFPSKEDLLAAGLSRSADELNRRLEERPMRQRKQATRLAHLFDMMTGVFCDRPDLGRALLRALVSGATSSSEAALSYRGQVFRHVLQALRGPVAEGEASQQDIERAMLLLMVWFSGQISWLSGLFDPDGIRAAMETAIRHIVRE